jgi:hypothetical protein
LPESTSSVVDVAPKGVAIAVSLIKMKGLRALAGVANIGSGPDGERAAKRLIDILIAGIRARSSRFHRKPHAHE